MSAPIYVNHSLTLMNSRGLQNKKRALSARKSLDAQLIVQLPEKLGDSYFPTDLTGPGTAGSWVVVYSFALILKQFRNFKAQDV